jgi:hypothetical protein
MVVDETKSGILVAFVIHSRDTEAVFTDAMTAWLKKMQVKYPDFKPEVFIVCDCTAAINAIL